MVDNSQITDRERAELESIKEMGRKIISHIPEEEREKNRKRFYRDLKNPESTMSKIFSEIGQAAIKIINIKRELKEVYPKVNFYPIEIDGELFINARPSAITPGPVSLIIPKSIPEKLKVSETKRTPRHHRRGYIYIVQFEQGRNIYKIGLTVNPEIRIKHFSVSMPNKIELIHVAEVSNMRIVEKSLHEMYGHKRVNGEWFELDESDIEHIKHVIKNIDRKQLSGVES